MQKKENEEYKIYLKRKSQKVEKKYKTTWIK
jgi:hypothetical protein